MASHLKILSQNPIYDETLEMVLFKQGRVSLSAQKNALGVYVEDTSENRKTLESLRYSYLPGNYTQNGNGLGVFVKDKSERIQDYYQLFVPYENAMDLIVPVAMKDSEPMPVTSQIASIVSLVNSSPFFYKNDMFALPVYLSNAQTYYMDTFITRPGLCSGVHLVHKTKGIVRLSVELTDDKSAYNLAIISKHKIYESSGG